MSGPERSARAFPAVLVVLVALVVLVLGICLKFGFVYDDRWTVLENPLLRAPGNVFGLLGRAAARAGIPDAGRPLMLATEILDWAIWGARPFGFHLQNLLWHTGVVLLVYGVLRRWGFGVGVAFATAALFAVHPLVVEPVVVINYREDPLAAFWLLLALWLAAPREAGGVIGRRPNVIGVSGASGASESIGHLRLLAAMGACVLATFSKESASVAPALWLIFVAAAPGPANPEQSSPQDLRKGKQRLSRPLSLLSLLSRLLPLWLLSLPVAFAFLWRWWVHGAANVVSLTAEVPALHQQRGWTIPRAALTYWQGLGQFVWPASLAPEYPDLAATGLVTALGWTAAVAIVVVTAVAWRLRHRFAGPALGWMIAVCAYLPHFGLVPLTNLRADRYFYMPVFGWAVLVTSLVGLGLARWWPAVRAGETPQQLGSPPAFTSPRVALWGDRFWVVAAPLAAALLLLGLRARVHARTFRDDLSLFTAAAASDPRSQRALVGLALAQLRAGQTLAAGEAAAQAVALGRSARALEARGLVALAQGDGVAARRDLEQAVAASEGGHRAQTLFHLGLAERRVGNLPRAETHLRAAIAAAPRYDRPALLLAQMAMDRDDLLTAHAVLDALLTRVPQSSDGWRLLARVHARRGQTQAAAQARRRARELGGEQSR